MITMWISQRSDGMDVAETIYEGQRFAAASRHGVTMVLARRLVAAGAEDQPWRAVGADGGVRLSGRSLHRLAKLTIEETPAGRFRTAAFDGRNAVDGLEPVGATKVAAGG